jgi:iron-sulfur cluster repair protein YtfE (RIC family)
LNKQYQDALNDHRVKLEQLNKQFAEQVAGDAHTRQEHLAKQYAELTRQFSEQLTLEQRKSEQMAKQYADALQETRVRAEHEITELRDRLGATTERLTQLQVSTSLGQSPTSPPPRTHNDPYSVSALDASELRDLGCARMSNRLN